MNIYFFENWKFNHKLPPPLLHTYQACKTVLTIQQNMKIIKTQKYQLFNSLVNWGRNLEVQFKLTCKNVNIPSLSRIEKISEV